MYFRSEATCEAIDMKIRQIKPIFTRETFALSLILKVRVFGIWKLPIGYCAGACEIWSVLPRVALWARLGASFLNLSKVAQDSSPKQSHSVFQGNTNPVSNGTCKWSIDCHKQEVKSSSNVFFLCAEGRKHPLSDWFQTLKLHLWLTLCSSHC